MKSLPREQIAHLPTKIEPLKNLTEALNGPKIYVKRDDQTGLAFGGNKTRKLEFLVAEAKKQGKRTLITTGALQSNHCRQTAAAAARFGFDCILILTGSEPQFPSANYLLDQLFGAEVVFTDRRKRDDRLKEEYEKAIIAGRNPYLVPYGGSNSTGAMGYVFAIQELISQSGDFDWIIFPSSSGGTQAGMVVGAKVFDLQTKILGISVDEDEEVLRDRVKLLAEEVIHQLELNVEIKSCEILVNAAYCLAGYGVLTKNELISINAFAKEEGLLLDPVYTGRAAGGMLDLINKGFFKRTDKVLFWHTGGTPGLFAEQFRGIIRE